MIKLIRAGLHRYRKSKIFIFGLISTILNSVFGSFIMLLYESAIGLKEGLAIQLITLAIIITIHTGNDYQFYGIKNQVISGYTKRDILLSQIIICNLINIFLLIILSIIPCSLALVFNSITTHSNRIIFDFLYLIDIISATIVLTSLFVVISFYIKDHAIRVFLCFFIICSMAVATRTSSLLLREEEYIQSYDDDKNIIYEKISKYISDSKQDFYMLTNSLLPITYITSDSQYMYNN